MKEKNVMSYTSKRSKEIIQGNTVNDIDKCFESFYVLGQASIIGFFLSLKASNDNFTSEDFKEAMMQFIKQNIQLRCDTYGVMAEYMRREDIKVK